MKNPNLSLKPLSAIVLSSALLLSLVSPQQALAQTAGAAVLRPTEAQNGQTPAPLQEALGSLPVNIAHLIFPADFYPDLRAGFSEVKASKSLISKSRKGIQTVYWYGMNFSSRLVMVDGDLFVEGYYRNLAFDLESKTEAFRDQPWFRETKTTNSPLYTYESKGASEQILEKMRKLYGENVVIYRGSRGNRLNELLKLKELALDPSKQKEAFQMAQEFVAKSKHGMFTTPTPEIARQYADPVFLSSKLPITELIPLVRTGELYVGIEYEYFELSFFGPKALMLFAKHLTVQK